MLYIDEYTVRWSYGDTPHTGFATHFEGFVTSVRTVALTKRLAAQVGRKMCTNPLIVENVAVKRPHPVVREREPKTHFLSFFLLQRTNERERERTKESLIQTTPRFD